MGIPASAESVRDLVDEQTLARIAAEAGVPLEWTRGSDCSVAELVSQRFGDQVVSRSVDPLLGGVYSGLAETIGVRAALPTLAAALDAGSRSLTDAVAAALPTPAPGPVFGALRDGYGILLDALQQAADATFVRGEASGLRSDGAGWNVDPLGSVDAVILAVPRRARRRCWPESMRMLRVPSLGSNWRRPRWWRSGCPGRSNFRRIQESW